MAKSFNIRKPHGMDAADAEARLVKLTTALEAKYGVTVQKKGALTQVKGRGVDGTAQIVGSDIVIDMKLGLPASLIAARIEEGVHQAIAEHFAKA